MWGRPGKTDHVQWHNLGHWVDVWRSGTFLLYSCDVAFWTQEMSPKLSNVDCSVAAGLRLWFAVNSLVVFLRMCHSSKCPPNTRPSLALALQVTCWVKKAWNKATRIWQCLYLALFLCWAECRWFSQTVDYSALSPLWLALWNATINCLVASFNNSSSKSGSWVSPDSVPELTNCSGGIVARQTKLSSEFRKTTILFMWQH